MEKKLSRLRFLIKSHSLFRILRLRKERKDGSLDRLDPIARANRIGALVCGYPFDLEHPRSFNEKISWLKFHYRDPLWERVADKLECKSFLEEIGLGRYAVPAYGSWDSVDEVDLDSLSEEFVLKATHDCGSVFLCRRGETDFEAVFARLRKAMGRHYSSEERNGEWVYDDIVPRVYAEKLLHPLPEFQGDIPDVKIQTAQGSPLFAYVVQDRSRDIRIGLLGPDLSPLPGLYTHLSPRRKGIGIERGQAEEMIAVAKKVGSLFPEVRVDFLVAREGIFISELTFFPTSGQGAFYPVSLDFQFGGRLPLPRE